MGALHLSCAVLLSLVFGAAVVGKARSRERLRAFAAELSGFSWLAAKLRQATAVVVVAGELASVVLIWTAARWGGLLALALLLAFSVATVSADRAADCQCFGVTTGEPAGSTGLFLTRNAVLTTAAAVVAFTPLAQPVLLTAIAAVLGGGLASVLAIRTDDLAYLLAGPHRHT
ncbi:MauE/DoxX family redox-associated membrane protein [Streptacidiphilus sp. EB103A]|uniref:MauE/DoxX family redox-associated membrane protein n=1 Tax=Streptacidiphilus sp. EB103A TaxID=3156275 RepID=UPI003517995D